MVFSDQWFDHLSAHVTSSTDKATIAKGRHKSALYTITLRHAVTRAEFTVTKSDFDFEVLRDQAKAALQHGHACEASCPWFYVDVTEHVPKRRLFTSPCSRRAVALHVKIYQNLFEHSLAFFRCPDTRTCAIASKQIPEIFFDFLFENQIQVRSTFLSIPDEVSPSSSISSSSSSTSGSRRYNSRKKIDICGDEQCGLCPLAFECGGISTLPCGHCFHDECILEALNNRLECPTCALGLDRHTIAEPLSISSY